jgi:hypothetical protein
LIRIFINFIFLSLSSHRRRLHHKR